MFIPFFIIFHYFIPSIFYFYFIFLVQSTIGNGVRHAARGANIDELLDDLTGFGFKRVGPQEATEFSPTMDDSNENLIDFDAVCDGPQKTFSAIEVKPNQLVNPHGNVPLSRVECNDQQPLVEFLPEMDDPQADLIASGDINDFSQKTFEISSNTGNCSLRFDFFFFNFCCGEFETLI